MKPRSFLPSLFCLAVLMLTLLTACGNAAVNASLKPFRTAVKAQPENARALYDLGSAAMAVGRWKEACRALKQCVAIDPAHIDAQMKLASTYQQLALGHRTPGCYRSVLMVDSTHVEANENLAVFGLNAIIEFEMCGHIGTTGRVRTITTEQQRMLNLCEMTQEEFLGLYEETEQAWNRLALMEPDDPLPWCGLGAIRNQRENYDGSVYAYQTALRMNPRFLDDRDVDQAIFLASRVKTKWIPPDPTYLMWLQLLQEIIVAGPPPPEALR